MARPNSLHTDSQEAGPSRPTSIRSVTPSRKGKERASDVESGSDDGDSETDTEDHVADKQTGPGASRGVSHVGASSKALDRATATHAGSSDGTDSEEDSEDEDDPDDVTGVVGGDGGLTQTSSNSASPPTLESHTKGSGPHPPAADVEEDSDDDIDEEEPVLKYSRVKGKIPEILAKDSASAVAVSARVLAIGTHVGMVHILSYEGAKVNSYRPHAASVTSLRMDEENDFVATASVEGRVVIHSITSTESYAFDYKRPMHCVALEPGFGKKTTRAFVCGGMAGNLIMQEKGWLGYKEQILHSGEGPIWAVEWRGNLIAWANDQGVKIYDTVSQQRIGYIDRGAHAPRAELFKCTLHWKDDSTLLIAWADYIKVIRIRTRSRPASSVGVNMSMPVSVGAAPSLFIEMTAIYQVDCMISGLVPFGSAYLILAYIPPDTYDNEATSSREEQRRKAANRPELRIIDKGEETSADALGISQFHTFGCNDYLLAPSKRGDEYFVVSPKDVVVVRKRDEADHVDWLVERERFEEALQAAEEMSRTHGGAVDIAAIGRKYMQHLVGLGDYTQAAALAPKVLAKDVQQWEEWINLFQQRGKLQTIIPVVPTKAPQLSKTTYETILNYFLLNDKHQLLSTIHTWPTEIYDLRSITDEVRSELEAVRTDTVLLEVMGELLVLNRQPEKALPYFLQIRKPNVFDLIRDYNLFTTIQSQALQLVDFDQERVRPQEADEERNAPSVAGKHGRAIELLVEHTHSIPIDKVVHQLESKPKYLYMYLDALFDRDQQVVLPYSDRMVELYALFDHEKLMPFLRSSNFYDLEKALKICKSRDYVTEQVFLLGRMGNNKQALMLIIERLGDVERAIDFAKEQRDEDLWEDLLSYSETRPLFIRALLEHVGSEINPIRLISRIKDGLEVPGLKKAVVKILQSSNLQAGLLQGCQSILEGDVDAFMRLLERGQTGCLRGSPATICPICDLPAYVQIDTSGDDDLTGPQPTLAYLCRHTVHARCALPHADVALPPRPESAAVNQLLSQEGRHGTKGFKRGLATRLGYAAALKVRVGSCPVCKRAKAGQSKVDSDATWGSGSKLIRTRA